MGLLIRNLDLAENSSVAPEKEMGPLNRSFQALNHPGPHIGTISSTLRNHNTVPSFFGLMFYMSNASDGHHWATKTIHQRADVRLGTNPPS